MDRRLFLGTLASGLLAAPLAAEARQVRRVRRIGVLSPLPLSWSIPHGFERLLRNRGLIQKRDYIFEARWADRKVERLEEFARELARLRVDIILAEGTEAATAASRATRDIPVVFTRVAGWPIRWAPGS